MGRGTLWRPLLAATFVSMLVLAGCSASEDVPDEDDGTEAPQSPSDDGETDADETAAGEPTSGGILAASLFREPTGLDPHINYAATTPPLEGNVYESLVFYDNAGELVPWLAESWDTPSPETYVFNLRPDVKFHDGSDLDAGDVVYSLDRVRDPEVGATRAPNLADVESVTATDDLTVEITLSEPDAAFLTVLSTVEAAILDSDWESGGGDYATDMNGTGPFVLDSYEPGVVYRLRAFEDYWDDDRPYLDGADITVIADESARVSALQSGEVELIDFVPWQSIEQLQDDPAYDVVLTSDSFNTIRLNPNAEPLTDKRVRQALNYAIDREALLQVAFGGFGVTQTVGLIHPDSPWYNQELDGHWEYDPDRARELLAEAGYEDPSELSFTLDTIALGLHSDTAQAIADQWQDLGIDVTIQTVEIPVLLENRTTGGYTATVDGLSTPWSDPSFYDAWFGTGGTAYASAVDYSNSELDALLEEARLETDQAARMDLYRQAEEIILDDAPLVFLYFRPQAEAMVTDLQGYVRIPGLGTESMFYYELDRVWLEE